MSVRDGNACQLDRSTGNDVTAGRAGPWQYTGVGSVVTIFSRRNDQQRHTKSGGLIAPGGTVNTREATGAVLFFWGKLKVGINCVEDWNVDSL